MKVLKLFISAVAVALLAFVGIGFALPGTWEVERTATLPATPAAVFDYLDSVEGWSSWAALGFVEGERSGPERGAGATLAWDDPQWGDGVWRLTEAERPRRVAYRVEVEDGSMVTHGRLTLEASEDGTRVRWTESGDFGWNPFLAYMALGMERMQGREMEKGLEELRARIGGEPPPGA